MMLVKFCGMKDNDTLSYAVESGVNYLGFIIDFPKSPRNISMDEFHKKVKWLRRNHDGNYKVVAVTVDMSINKLEFIIKEKMADIIQLHGAEHPSICKQLRGKIEIWKAFSQTNKMNESDILNLAESVDKALLDSGTAKEKATGESGLFNDSELYNMLKRKGIEVVLSGGINAANVLQFIMAFKPSIIDISSGIESSPGKKSRQKIREFMDTLHSNG